MATTWGGFAPAPQVNPEIQIALQLLPMLARQFQQDRQREAQDARDTQKDELAWAKHRQLGDYYDQLGAQAKARGAETEAGRLSRDTDRDRRFELLQAQGARDIERLETAKVKAKSDTARRAIDDKIRERNIKLKEDIFDFQKGILGGKAGAANTKLEIDRIKIEITAAGKARDAANKILNVPLWKLSLLPPEVRANAEKQKMEAERFLNDAMGRLKGLNLSPQQGKEFEQFFKENNIFPEDINISFDGPPGAVPAPGRDVKYPGLAERFGPGSKSEPGTAGGRASLEATVKQMGFSGDFKAASDEDLQKLINERLAGRISPHQSPELAMIQQGQEGRKNDEWVLPTQFGLPGIAATTLGQLFDPEAAARDAAQRSRATGVVSRNVFRPATTKSGFGMLADAPENFLRWVGESAQGVDRDIEGLFNWLGEKF